MTSGLQHNRFSNIHNKKESQSQGDMMVSSITLLKSETVAEMLSVSESYLAYERWRCSGIPLPHPYPS